MADVDIGYFTRQQARETWEIVKLLRSSGLLRNIAESKPHDDPGIHHIWVQNISGEVIPPYACMQIDGTEVVGGLTHLKVKKPTAIDSQYVFNHDREIPIDGFGMALPWGIVRMLGSGSASPNTLYGATPGAWSIQIQEDDGPFVVYGDDKDENVFKGRMQKGFEPQGSEVIFRFETSDYDEEVPDACDEQVATDAASFRVKVIGAPCGSGEIPDADDDNFITVLDTLGWLEGRDERDLPGRIGIAGRFGMLDEYGEAGECKWVIKTINMFRARVNVTEVIDETDQITIRTERQVVWDHCELPDEAIITTDCPENEYEDYSI